MASAPESPRYQSDLEFTHSNIETQLSHQDDNARSACVDATPVSRPGMPDFMKGLTLPVRPTLGDSILPPEDLAGDVLDLDDNEDQMDLVPEIGYISRQFRSPPLHRSSFPSFAASPTSPVDQVSRSPCSNPPQPPQRLGGDPAFPTSLEGARREMKWRRRCRSRAIHQEHLDRNHVPRLSSGVNSGTYNLHGSVLCRREDQTVQSPVSRHMPPLSRLHAEEGQPTPSNEDNEDVNFIQSDSEPSYPENCIDSLSVPSISNQAAGIPPRPSLRKSGIPGSKLELAVPSLRSSRKSEAMRSPEHWVCRPVRMRKQVRRRLRRGGDSKPGPSDEPVSASGKCKDV